MFFFFFFFKQKTAYEMRISDWSSDVCSSDLRPPRRWRQACLRAARPLALHICQNGRCLRRKRHPAFLWRSEERRVGKELSVRVDLGGRRIIKKKKTQTNDTIKIQYINTNNKIN